MSQAPTQARDTNDTTSAQVVSLYQREAKIYARSVTGYFANWRVAMVWLTQLFFYGMPWLQWNGRQAMLFELETRRFYIFELVLYPQDFIYLTVLLIICAYGLFLFTAVAGRLWCGYACPQTVYTEIFMWVERRIEGDRNARMRLDAQGWGAERLLRKSAKHLVWIAIGLWTGFTFVGYFTPIRELAASALALSFGPWEAFWVLFYGFATYGNAGFMREQVCKYMCPYARFQGAMFDRDTLIIGYDVERGEPRGSRSKKADYKAEGLGSCIDCNLCVHVCPTGIDIRQGLQNECIGCAACIDVCDGVMDKMNYPRGLIRYDTENGMEQHLGRSELLRRVLRPRVLLYGAGLLVICTAFIASIWLRAPLRLDVVRDRATLARVVDEGQVENIYRLQILNVAESPQRVTVQAEGLPGLAIVGPASYALEPTEARWVTVAVRMPPEAAGATGSGAHPMRFIVQRVTEGERKASVSEPSTFVIPR